LKQATAAAPARRPQRRKPLPRRRSHANHPNHLERHPCPPPNPARRSDPTVTLQPNDAIYAAAFYLCDNGARDGRDIRAAIFAYNHANWYVDKVLAQAALYRATPAGGGHTSQAAQVAVAFAQAQLGKPYV
jgi:hypothetical protein